LCEEGDSRAHNTTDMDHSQRLFFDLSLAHDVSGEISK